MSLLTLSKRLFFTGLILLLLFLLLVFGLWLIIKFSADHSAGHVVDTSNARATHSASLKSADNPLFQHDNVDDYFERLSGAVKFKTVSARGLGSGKEDFEGFNALLHESYPRAISRLELVFKSEHSLLFALKGSKPDIAPVLLIAHSDVVPAQTRQSVQNKQNDENQGSRRWTYPPFSGVIDKEHIWGRGTLDNKSAILAMMEALEKRLIESGTKQSFQPQRTLYLAFTHDEEVGGHVGAKQLAEYFRKHQIRPYFVLDEGQALTQGVVPNIEQPVALIGVTQKGYMTVELSTQGEPGHSMMPPKATAIAQLSEAVYRLNESPMPPKLTGPIKAMFRELSVHMAFPKDIVLFHTWLTEGLVTKQLAQKKATDALIRSSMSVNTINGGIAENVLPKQASALVNYRIAPHNTSAEILAHIETVLAGLPVSMRVVSAIEEPAPISSHEQEPYRMVEGAINTVFPDALVAPSITLSTTDSRHFADLTDTILRFCPIFLKQEDLSRFHGIDERISKNNYIQMIDFYNALYESI